MARELLLLRAVQPQFQGASLPSCILLAAHTHHMRLSTRHLEFAGGPQVPACRDQPRRLAQLRVGGEELRLGHGLAQVRFCASPAWVWVGVLGGQCEAFWEALVTGFCIWRCSWLHVGGLLDSLPWLGGLSC